MKIPPPPLQQDLELTFIMFYVHVSQQRDSLSGQMSIDKNFLYNLLGSNETDSLGTMFSF